MADILKGIGRALGKAGQFLDDARMEYHYGRDWRKKAAFLEEMQALEAEGERIKLQGERQRQDLSLESAARARQAAELARVEAAVRFAETIGASGAVPGVDTTGLPGSELAGPPAEGAEQALAGASVLPEAFGASPELQKIAQSVGVRTAVRTTEDRKRKRAHEETALADAATRRSYAAREQGRQDAEEARAQRREDRASGKIKPKLTEAQIRSEGRRRAGDPIDYASRAEWLKVVEEETQAVRDSLTEPEAPQAPRAPKVGTIVRGYRFKGGSPADPNAWERAR